MSYSIHSKLFIFSFLQTPVHRKDATSIFFFAIAFASLFILITLSEVANAQTITGSVIDAETGEPLPSANIYLSNTTYGSASGPDGYFQLTDLEPGQYQLVVRFIGYKETVRPLDVLPATTLELGDIPLQPAEPHQLDELEVISSRNPNRDYNLERFTEIFMGSSENAEHTQIMNPKVLSFESEPHKPILTATAEKPIHVLNRALGYEYYISLQSFRWNTHKDTGEFYFTSRITELPPSNREMSGMWRSNREETYNGSFRHFLDLLITGDPEETFKLTNGDIEEVLPNSSEELSAYASRRYSIYRVDTGRRNRPLKIRYKRKYRSEIETRYENLLMIDNYGNLRNPKNVILSGQWSESRVADLLPSNYRSPGNSSLDKRTDMDSFTINKDHFEKSLLDPSMRRHTGAAVDLLNSDKSDTKTSSFPLARTYLMLVSVQNRKDLFDVAVKNFLETMIDDSVDPAFREAVRYELISAEPILTNDEYRKLKALYPGQTSTLARKLGEFFREKDPTPNTVINERLIEHYRRIHQARQAYPDQETDLKTDDRGRIHIKYGDPDFKFDKPFNINRGDIFEFVSEFQFLVDEQEETQQSSLLSGGSRSRSTAWLSDGSERSSQSQAYVIVDEIERMLDYIPYGGNFTFWIYNDINDESEENTLFYFSEERDNVFKEISTLENWISPSLFLSRSAMSSANFAPALALQYITYQRLKYYDRQIMERYNNMQSKVFNSSIRRSDAHLKQLSKQIRDRHKINTLKRQSNAAVEKSGELTNVDNIPMSVHQYRFLDDNEKRIWVTFLESRPVSAFLNDLTHNQDMMINENWQKARIISETSKWYELKKGVEFLGPEMQPRGRISVSPSLMIDESNEDTPSMMVMDIPHSTGDLTQKFYAYLENRHPESSPQHQTIFPTELRGIGRISKKQEEHFDSSVNNLILSDLLIGHTRLEDDSHTRFPFVISHDRKIPTDNNLIIHFEVYRLQMNPAGIAEFDLTYEFKKRSQRNRWFGKNSESLTGSLTFTTDDNRFSESLEIKDLQFEEGRYTLTFRVEDKNSAGFSEQQIDFEVVDEETIFRSSKIR